MLPELARRMMCQFAEEATIDIKPIYKEDSKPICIKEEKPQRYQMDYPTEKNYVAYEKPKDLLIAQKENISPVPMRDTKQKQSDTPNEKPKHKEMVQPNYAKNAIDLQPIKGMQKPFETLIEESLQKSSFDNREDVQSNKPKREFLKRKVPTVAPCQALKKYSYYADKAEKDPQSVEVNEPEKLAKPKKCFLKKGNGIGISKGLKTSGTKNNNSKLDDSKTERQLYEKLEKEVEKDMKNEEIAYKPEAHSTREKTTIITQKEDMSLCDTDIAGKKAELENEIRKYKIENEKLNKLKKECEKETKKLSKKIEEIDILREQEKKEFEALKETEIKKIQQEKRIMERQTKALQNMPNKKEKTEIEALKKETDKLQEESKAKDLKYKLQIERIKKQYDDLTNTNKTLTEENHKLQKEKLQTSFHKEETCKNLIKENQQLHHKKKSFHEEENIPTDYQEKKEPSDNESDKIEDADEKELNCSQENSDDEHEKKEDTDEYERPKESEKNHLKTKHAIMADQYSLQFPPKYNQNANDKLLSQKVFDNGKTQKLYESGKKEIIFGNGVKREIHPDNYTVVYFNNGDVKQAFPDGKIVYFFAEANTTQTTLPEGVQVFKFANNQLEKHFTDGTKEIKFPDGTLKCIYKSGEEESVFPDGTIQRLKMDGAKELEYQDGTKEIIQHNGTKIKEFADGRIAITHPNGEVEYTHKE